MKLELVELPDSPAGHVRVTDEVVAELKTNPGQWAKWPTELKASSARVRAAMLKRQCPGVEAVTRGGILFVRWVGAR